MSAPSTPSELDARPPLGSSSTAPEPRSSRVKSGLASTACGIAALFAAVSTVAPWWYVTISTAGTVTSAFYYPGTSIRVISDGGSGTATYADAHVPLVGILYAVVLVASVGLAIAATVAAVLGVASTRRRPAGPRSNRRRRSILLGALGDGLLLAVLLPVAQPILFRADNPSGACTGASPLGECTAFWGSSGATTASTIWGAGLGWWLDATATVLLAGALYVLVSGTTRARADGPNAVAPDR